MSSTHPTVCMEAKWKIKVDVSRYTADLIHISMGVNPLAGWGLSVCMHVFTDNRFCLSTPVFTHSPMRCRGKGNW